MTCPSWVALHGMAHSFTGLYKALGHNKAVIYEGVKDSWESENSPSESTPGLGSKKKKKTQRQTRSDCTVRKESVIQLKNIEYRTGRERLREAWKVGRSRKEERQLMQEL